MTFEYSFFPSWTDSLVRWIDIHLSNDIWIQLLSFMNWYISLYLLFQRKTIWKPKRSSCVRCTDGNGILEKNLYHNYNIWIQLLSFMNWYISIYLLLQQKIVQKPENSSCVRCTGGHPFISIFREKPSSWLW